MFKNSSRATQPDGIGSLESILGLLLSLKISGSEYQAFSSVVRIGSPPPPAPDCVSPWFQVWGGGWGTMACGWGSGVNSDDGRESLVLSVSYDLQSTYVCNCRVQSSVWRLPKYWPPNPSPRVCPPSAPKADRGTHSPGGEGVGGQYFGRPQTLDWPITV
jgi:hypothetical protein